ncbi:MAG: ABC transporter permease [Rhodospirillales bacterium]|nr:ABC transporter permease [Rhodospirillales bacterium]MDE2199117.1 ABC transporter permease [Rhodospirillales bacterium]MDE2573766.1 ABC transporter permease [Rhodospirillales bacterium]
MEKTQTGAKPASRDGDGPANAAPQRPGLPAMLLEIPGVVPALSFAGFVALWWAGAAWNGNSIQLPTPPEVFGALVSLARDGELFTNAGLSLSRLIVSMSIAVLIAVPLGFWMGLSETLRRYVDPTIELLRPISGIAWIPLALFIFGVGGVLPVFIMTYVAFFPLVMNTFAGVRGADPKLVAAARTMGVGRLRITARVVLPSALPTIMVGVRLALAGAWSAIIAAELIGAPTGLGFAIEWYRELLASPKVFAYVGVIAGVGYLADLALQWLQRRLTPWTVGGGLS